MPGRSGAMQCAVLQSRQHNWELAAWPESPPHLYP